MANRSILDTSILIKKLKQLRQDSTPADAERLAKELIVDYRTRAIVSPVEIEVLAGVRDAHELDLTETFLLSFEIVDRGRITAGDWETTRNLAKRVVKYDREQPRRPKKRKREQNPRTEARDLGDCLILAIAKRMHYEVSTLDKGMTMQSGRTAWKK
jgi:predicted nucleic acid-binding protein